MSARPSDPAARPFASVVVVAHNSAEFIESSLLSLERQTLSDLEIIVVDDGSTDRTVDVVERHRPSVTLLQQPNLGVAAARNHGISVSTGAWVAVLDADDLWGATRLEEFAAYIDDVPGCRAIATEATTFAAAEDERPLRARGEIPHIVAKRSQLVESALRVAAGGRVGGRTWTSVEVLTRDDLLRDYPIRSPAFLVQRATLMQAGLFQVTSTGVSDMSLAFNLAAVTPIHFLRHAEPGRATALYRLQPQSLSQTQDMGLMLLAQLAAQHFGSIAGSRGASTWLRRQASADYRKRYLHDTLRYALDHGQWWRWHTALGLGYALMPDRAGRAAVLREGVTAAARTVPVLRALRRMGRLFRA